MPFAARTARLQSLLLTLAAVAGCGSGSLLHAQHPAQPPAAAPTPAANGSEAGATYTLRVTAREVVLDVIARGRIANDGSARGGIARGRIANDGITRDEGYRPVGNLEQNDFQIFEIVGPGDKRPRRLSAFQLIDPAVQGGGVPVASGGYHVALSGGCAAGITVHYRLSFQPSAEGWKGGYHEILVTTTRPGVTLTFRHTYYVGQTEAAAAVPDEAQALASLRRAACFHGDLPASLGLNGHLVEAAPAGMMRYALRIDPDSLAFSSISDAEHRVALDYGACVFSEDGAALQFLHHSAARELTPQEYAKVSTEGFPNTLDLPRRADASMVRLVVRDRATGNLGILEMSAGADGRTLKKDKPRNDASFTIVDGRPMRVTHATGSFGTIVPQTQALCGDVYELKPGTPRIITNFGEQDAVGRLYTPMLDVHQQTVVGGLAGATANEEWFSIDYYGEFRTTVAGDYHFRLLSDDGANLYIDDRLVIEEDGIHSPLEAERRIHLDAGRHTIHLPYFQGPLLVTLILEMKAPGHSMEVLDLRKFGPPPGGH